MSGFRSFAVRLPSGLRYWTVLDASHRVVSDVDEFLLHCRLGRDAAESTTESYATSLALFLQWAASVGRDWRATGPLLGRFVFWLQYYQPDQVGPRPAAPVRGPRRVNAVLAAVRSFFRYAAMCGLVPVETLAVLYETPDGLRPATQLDHELRRYRIRSRHRLSAPDSPVTDATGEEVVALVRAARSARDRFLVIALWRLGLRRGELVGLRRSDVHFVPESSRLGCRFAGGHLHVVRRDNPNRAAAKSRRDRVVPADWLTVQAYDQYVVERLERDPAGRSDFLLVNLFTEPVGGAMHPGGVNDVLLRLSRRAGLSRRVHPHMLRHSFATNVAAAGGTADELQALLGHAWISSSQVYLHPSRDRLRAAVERVPSPRSGAPRLG